MLTSTTPARPPRASARPYIQPGIYFPTVILTDATGSQTVVSTVVQVKDPIAFDQFLQGKWTGLKDALRSGDVDRALTFIFTRSRSRCEAIFRGLAQDLPDVDSIPTNIQPLEVRGAETIYKCYEPTTESVCRSGHTIP